MHRHERRSRQDRSGDTGAFSLVEVMVSVVIVGGLLVVALDMVGASRATQFKLAERAGGLRLAEDLMAEILQRPYSDPDTASSNIGLEDGETAVNRMDFDDVDDYHGWTASPPQERSGQVIPDTEGYRRSVHVGWVQLNNVEAYSATDTGLKRITVTVQRNGRVVAELIALRSIGWESPCGARRDGS